MDPLEKVTNGIQAATGLTKAIETLGLDPCVLTIVLLVICCMLFMAFYMKHLERMEGLRIQQFEKLKYGK